MKFIVESMKALEPGFCRTKRLSFQPGPLYATFYEFASLFCLLGHRTSHWSMVMAMGS